MTPNDRTMVERELHLMLNKAGLLERWNAHFVSLVDSGVLFRQDVNRFMRVQLGTLDIDTQEARLCLSDDYDYRQWLKMLERHIVPILKRYSLPVAPATLSSWLNASK